MNRSASGLMHLQQKNQKSSKTAAASKNMATKWITKSTKDYYAEVEQHKQSRDASAASKPMMAAAANDGYDGSEKDTNSSKGNRHGAVDARKQAARGTSAVAAQAQDFFAQHNKEGFKNRVAARQQQKAEIQTESDRLFEMEMSRLRDDTGKRWKKGVEFFKRQGITFTLVYIAVYLGCLLVLYAVIASGAIKKEAVFEYLVFGFGDYINKEKFYDRVEAWDTYINFGFAFILNEFLEVFRMPTVLFIYFCVAPMVAKRTIFNKHRRVNVKKSIFRWNAAEQ